MKVSRIFSREFAAVLALVCFLCVGAQQGQAQSTFSYPPFPASAATGLQTNGSAGIVSGVLQLTPAAGTQAGSAWYTNPGATTPPAPVSLVTGFTTTFTFQFTNRGGINGSNGVPGADGIAFVIQNGGFNGYFGDNTMGAGAVGPTVYGGEIGFTGLTKSVAVQFDTWCNSEYGDICATNDQFSSADQITVESCGTGANNVNHHAGCDFGTRDLSVLESPIYLADGNPHNATITYVAPPSTGNCAPGGIANTGACGSLTIMLDGQTVLVVPFSLAYLGLDANQDAYAGFTGATGGAYEIQDINNWSFGITVVQSFNPNGTTSSSFGSNGFDNSVSIDTSNASNDLTCNNDSSGTQGSCGPLTLITSNNLILSNDPAGIASWPQYVVGTPWAPSFCSATAANGGSGNLCSLFVNQCYGGGGSVLISQASDFYCPMVTSGSGGSILVTQTLDFSPPKPLIAPGTTVATLDFSPSTPAETWMPSPTSGTGSTSNPVCTYVAGNPNSSPQDLPYPNTTPSTMGCDVVSPLLDVYGDQTTTRTKLPQNKGWFISVFNVPMLLTSVQVKSALGCSTPNSPLNDSNPGDANFESPTYAANIWNKGNCLLDFVVNPAQPPTPSNDGNHLNNHFQAAPPAGLFWGQGDPAVQPGAYPPSGDPVYSNPNPVCTSLPPALCAPSAWDLQTANNTNILLSSLGEGSHTIHWSATDVVGISEKNVFLIPSGPGPCYNPTGGPAINPPCYNTSYFTTQVNVDSVAPQPQGSCVADGAWHATNVTLNCSASDALSGIASANPGVGTSLPVSGGTAVPFGLSTTVPAGQETNNASTGSEQLCDWANNCATFGPIGGNKIDEKSPVITITTPTANRVIPAYSSVASSYTCTDGGSGVAKCNGTPETNVSTVTLGAALDTTPNGLNTPKTLTIGAGSNTYDQVGNVATPASVNYSVSCNYASVLLNSPVLPKGISVNPAATMLTNCLPTAQKVIITLTLTGPFGASCSTSTQAIFPLPIPVTLAVNENKVPLPGVILFVPKTACSGPGFTFSTNTYQNVNGKQGALLGAYTQAVTVK